MDNERSSPRRDGASERERGRSQTRKPCTGALELADEIQIAAINAAVEEELCVLLGGDELVKEFWRKLVCTAVIDIS